MLREGIELQVTKIGSNRWAKFVRVRDNCLFASGSHRPFAGKLRELKAAFKAYSAEDLAFANSLNFEGLDKNSEDAQRAIRIRNDLVAMIYA